MTTTDGDLLTILTNVILTDRAAGGDINQCQDAGLDVLTASRNLHGWHDPMDNIARGEINAVQFAQALQLARAQRDRQARQ